ncbi:toll/interleukin-1 receptor domain-containing protein [Ornithinibacillus sp. JPR2-1]|uniref:toll/interleukin-1 receptor domain-containing protein n=1 Tax=Ornithinibacillus sp. JPR2-1 TaxID=2094019 RepID=UPI0031DDA2D6
MIFISHQHKDKDFVGEIARALEENYGEDKVFYDDWSIKPGENIISRMSEGILECEFFFFIITENSLKSEMVTMEWTSALREKSKREIKFIPVRADNVNPPTIISALNYLDLYNQGMEVTIKQIMDIVSGAEKEKDYPTFNNLISYVHEVSSYELHFYITVKRFYEPNGKFIIFTDLNENQASLEKDDGTMFGTKFIKEVELDRNRTLNAFSIDTLQGIKKGFKVKLVFKKNVSGNHTAILFHLKSETKGVPIQMKVVRDLKEIPEL